MNRDDVELARISRESCCSVQHGLNLIKVTLRQSSQGDVTVVDLDIVSMKY